MNIDARLVRRFVPAARVNLLVLAFIWAVAVAIGFVCLFNYQTEVGKSGAIPVTFPEFSQMATRPDQPTLIMFAHPRCPCTRASLGELARVVSRLQDEVRAYVVFYLPETMDPEWAATDLVTTALAIPGVDVLHDKGGLETRRFRVRTSGHVLLYDKLARLSFTGGITSARGHYGDNEGSKELLARATQSHSNITSKHVVFGCPILNETN